MTASNTNLSSRSAIRLPKFVRTRRGMDGGCALSNSFNLALMLCLFISQTVTGAQEPSPLKVFILAGQSNMQGHAHVRTLDHLGMDPETVPLLTEIRNDDGTRITHEKVRIAYLSSEGEKQGTLTVGFGANDEKIGPELTFGIFVQKHLNEPILIIKTAWGGKSLHTDFRSPSAGPYVFSEQQMESFKKQGKNPDEVRLEKSEATGRYYRLMMDYVKKVLIHIQGVYPDYNPDQGYELSGFVWFQGWNDMVDGGVYPDRAKSGGYDAYSDNLVHLIRDVRKDLATLDLPFVIGVLGVGGPVEKYGPEQQRYKGIHQNFRLAMAAPAAMPEFKGNVAAVFTENDWDNELSELTSREQKIQQESRRLQSEKGLSREEQNAIFEKMRAEAFDARELEILATGISNQEYHYLGSAKIMARIGKSFAEAVLNKRSGDFPVPESR